KTASPRAKSVLLAHKRKCEAIQERIGFPSGRIVQTGLARHDRLVSTKTDDRSLRKKVVVFFTWRDAWRNDKAGREKFSRFMLDLLRAPSIKALAEERGLRFEIFIHYKQSAFGSAIEKRLPPYAQWIKNGDVG